MHPAGFGVGQALLPVGLGQQDHRKLDHLLGLELRRAHAVQHIDGGERQRGAAVLVTGLEVSLDAIEYAATAGWVLLGFFLG